MKVVFVTRNLEKQKTDGGVLGSIEKYKYLCTLYGYENVKMFVIEKPKSLTRVINMLFLQGYGETSKNKNQFKEKIKNCDIIAFNSSIYGSYVKLAAKRHIKNIVFYHNVEANFYLAKFLTEKTVSSFLYYKYIVYNEKKVTKFSDIKIVLNKRDSEDLHKRYHICAHYILPITLPTPTVSDLLVTNAISDYALFVGSDFFSNRQGLSWYIENVLPKTRYNLHVVGSVCNYLKSKYVNVDRLFLEGYVDDVRMWYNSAAFVVSPIFSGSGMKTKTIEALAYGKTIFGTREAFVGIEGDYQKIGCLCNTAEEFIRAVNAFASSVKYNAYAKALFDEKYSFDKNAEKFAKVLKDTHYL